MTQGSTCPVRRAVEEDGSALSAPSQGLLSMAASATWTVVWHCSYTYENANQKSHWPEFWSWTLLHLFGGDNFS